MSQRLKAGLSWPGFAVSAGEPDEVGPGMKYRTWAFSVSPLPFPPRSLYVAAATPV